MLVDFLEVEAAEIHLIDPAIGGCEDLGPCGWL